MIVGSRTTLIGKPAAFIYTRDAGRLDWSLEAILEPPATDSDQDSFGQIVAIEGDFAAVGSPHAAAGGGAVYIYKLSSSWTLTDTLYSRNGSSRFGSDLSICNKKLLVAAGRPFTKAASIDYFLYDLTSAASPPIGLAPLAPITFAHYTRAAALSSTHAFIAYPSAVDGASSYLFIYLLADLSQTQVIVSPIISSFSRLSASTTSGLLAAADDNHRNVNVYSLSASSSQWAQEAVLPSPVDRLAIFGAALAIEDDRLIVGAPAAAGLEDVRIVWRMDSFPSCLSSSTPTFTFFVGFWIFSSVSLPESCSPLAARCSTSAMPLVGLRQSRLPPHVARHVP